MMKKLKWVALLYGIFVVAHLTFWIFTGLAFWSHMEPDSLRAIVVVYFHIGGVVAGFFALVTWED